jgi:hypothetical protein
MRMRFARLPHPEFYHDARNVVRRNQISAIPAFGE